MVKDTHPNAANYDPNPNKIEAENVDYPHGSTVKKNTAIKRKMTDQPKPAKKMGKFLCLSRVMN